MGGRVKERKRMRKILVLVERPRGRLAAATKLVKKAGKRKMKGMARWRMYSAKTRPWVRERTKIKS